MEIIVLSKDGIKFIYGSLILYWAIKMCRYNQNILLEAKLESLTKDYNELQNKVKYQEAGIEE